MSCTLAVILETVCLDTSLTRAVVCTLSHHTDSQLIYVVAVLDGVAQAAGSITCPLPPVAGQAREPSLGCVRFSGQFVSERQESVLLDTGV